MTVKKMNVRTISSDERGHHSVVTGRVIAEAVRCEPADRCVVTLWSSFQQNDEHAGRDDGADQLCSDVARRVFPSEAFAGAQPDGDCRIQMTSGDRTERICAAEHRETERE